MKFEKEISYQDMSNQELEKIQVTIKKILEEREGKREEQERFEAEKKFYQELRELKQKLGKKSIRSAYDELADRKCYREVQIDIPEFGESIPCYYDDCWYNGNLDRIGEFDGTMNELMFRKGLEDVKFCEVCFSNGRTYDDAIESIDWDWVKETYGPEDPVDQNSDDELPE